METPLNNRLDDRRKDSKSLNAKLACKHFNKDDHDFNINGKRIIIGQLRKITTISLIH